MDEQTQTALSEFFQATERRAYRMAEFETRNPDDAIELVQDAMVALMKKYTSRPTEEWSALFYRILHNRIMDWHRRKQIGRNIFSWWDNDEQEVGDMAVAEREVGSNPGQNYDEDLSMQRLQRELEKLSTRQRQVFLLRVWEGFDVKTTAGIMRCSAGSVKTHLSRALGHLREALGEYR